MLEKYPLRMSETPTTTTSQKSIAAPPPICIAIRLQFVLECFWCPLHSEEREYCQYSSHLYRSTPPHLYCNTPPICITALLDKSWWLWSPGCSPIKTPRFERKFRSLVVKKAWAIKRPPEFKLSSFYFSRWFVVGRCVLFQASAHPCAT